MIMALALYLALVAEPSPIQDEFERLFGTLGEFRSDAHESISLRYRATAFLRRETRTDHIFSPVEWRRTTSAREILRGDAPLDSAVSQASLSCGLAEDGGLQNCRVDDSFPSEARWRQYAARLVDGFFTTPEYARRIRERVREIVVHLEIRNSRGEERPGGCISPFCVIHHGPPPPPPPPPPRTEPERGSEGSQ